MRISYKNGDKIGHAEFLRDIVSDIKWTRKAIFRCKCGNEFEGQINKVKGLQLKGCKQCRYSRLSQNKTKHGHANAKKVTSEYAIWSSMKGRCLNSNNRAYKNYGARGIVPCKEWLKFDNFLADMGYRPSINHSLDRIDNNKGYFKENCRWATVEEQARNKRVTHFLTYNGETLCIADWAKRIKIPVRQLNQRITKFKWTAKRALETPIFLTGQHHKGKRRGSIEIKHSFGFIQ